MTAALALTSPRTELAVRESDGVSVALYWTRGTNILAVTVVDTGSGTAFELVLTENEPPLDVFYHPYAYAATRGLDVSGSGVRDSRVTVDV
jgi:hypothetical protein